MLAVLLPLAGGLLGVWLLISAAMAWGARRAESLKGLPGPEAFRRPPTAGSEAPRARIAFLGDVQRGIADIDGPLSEALRADGADLLVSSGDLVSHGEAPYYGIAIRGLEQSLAVVPMRAVPGNHDLMPRRSKDDRIGGALFEERFGARRFALRCGPVLVVGIDNGAPWLVEDQLPWLEATLAEHAGTPWILVCHIPVHLFDQPERPTPEDMTCLLPVLAKQPPALVVSGHLHAFFDETIDGVRHIVNAHGGDVHGLAIRREDFQVLWVDVTADGVDAEVKSYARKRNSRTYLDQLAVRFWSDRRKWWGALLAWPGRMVLSLFGADVPVERHPVERRHPPKDVLVARRREELVS